MSSADPVHVLDLVHFVALGARVFLLLALEWMETLM
jgi:hypothetical protein